jgi:AraC-like DNA-binding protein
MNKLDRQRPEADRLAGDVTPAALPADLVRALDWLRSHLSEPVDLDLLASVAGVRPRTLESYFKTFLGTTPLGWLRRTRFANVRRALERGGADATVTRIALASGFVQLGRFAAEYRAIFGETPSTTLRRSRSVLEGGDEPIDDEAFRLTWEAIPRVFAIAPRECSEAISTLESAQRLAPDYGLPVALAAWCLGQRAAHGFGAMPEHDRNKALELVARAQTLAPNDALALTLASGALTLAHRLEDADRVLERALALDPWLPYAWVRRGWASSYVGDPGAAFRELASRCGSRRSGPCGRLRLSEWVARILHASATSARRVGCKAVPSPFRVRFGRTVYRPPPPYMPAQALRRAALRDGSCARIPS